MSYGVALPDRIWASAPLQQSVPWLDPLSTGITVAISGLMLCLLLFGVGYLQRWQLPGMRTWTAGAAVASAGVGLHAMHGYVPMFWSIIVPLLCSLGGAYLIWMGVRRLSGRSAPWLPAVGVSIFVLAPLNAWLLLDPERTPIRVAINSCLMASVNAMIWWAARSERRRHYRPGMRVVMVCTGVLVFAQLLRAYGGLVGVSGNPGPLPNTPLATGLTLAAGACFIGTLLGLVLLASAQLLHSLDTLVRTDPLTGLANRHGLRSELDGWPPSARLAVILLDLDHFKRVNDTHGHSVGDQVLRGVGAHLMRHALPGMLPVRLGGEELGIVWCRPRGDAPSAQEARAWALQFVQQMREQDHEWMTRAGQPGKLRVTVSAGVATGTVAGFEPTLRRADEALYRAKAAGRDRVEVDGL